MDSQNKYNLVQKDYDSVHASFQNSYDSTREFATQIKSFLSYISGGGGILNIGGTLNECSYFADNSFVVTDLDISHKMLDLVTEDPRISCVNGNILSFYDKPKYGFDGIWACRSLIHIPPDDISKVLANIFSLSAQGSVFGSIFFTSLSDIKEEYLPETHTEEEGTTYYRVLYPMNKILNEIKTAGFKVEKTEKVEDQDNEKAVYIEALRLK